MKVHFREQYGTKGQEILYVTPVDQESIVRFPITIDNVKKKEPNAFSKLFQRIFLPQGYPDSVSPDYIQYQIWDTIQAFCSTISGTLTTHAILKGVGVGSDVANPLSATITWILKDGIGHFGKILFAWSKGTELDIDSKKWRIRADVLNDLAMGIEIFVLPYFEQKETTYILCVTTTMKAIVGVAGGATRSALTQHHAIRGNLADVASKDSAQETFVNLIASFVGLFLLTTINNQSILYSLFFLITCLHIFANIRAVKSVCLSVFNESRYLIALEEYFRSGRLLNTKDVNRLERVTIGKTVSVSLKIKMGLSIRNLTDQYKTSTDVKHLISIFDVQEKFLIAEHRKYIGVYLDYNVKAQDILKAYFFAVSHLQDRSQLKERYRDVQMKWLEFLTLAQKEGWNTTSHLFFVDEYRIDWKL